jgi:HAD superfamily hydrolase (TIGR01450 family)
MNTPPNTPLDGADAVLTDLDGVVYWGDDAVPYAIESLRACAGNLRLGFVTNNASRSSATVAAHLERLGLPASADDVITSAQVATGMLGELVAPGSAVLVIGGDGLFGEVRRAGFTVVARADESPQAVIQGFAHDVGWEQLTQASFALAATAEGKPIPWIATNLDQTIPVAGGVAPGNGALVDVVRATTGGEPLSAGKPQTAIYRQSAARLHVSSPLFIGDRLDTDVAGAKTAGLRSALVLTGVTSPPELLLAAADQRPDFILADLRDLHAPYTEPEQRPADGAWVAGDAAVREHGGKLEVIAAGSRPVELVRAAAAAIWHGDTDPHSVVIPEALSATSVG